MYDGAGFLQCDHPPLPPILPTLTGDYPNSPVLMDYYCFIFGDWAADHLQAGSFLNLSVAALVERAGIQASGMLSQWLAILKYL